MSYRYRVGDQVELFKDGKWIAGVVERVSIEYSCFYVKYQDEDLYSSGLYEVLFAQQDNFVRSVTGDNYVKSVEIDGKPLENVKSVSFKPYPDDKDRADWLQIYCAAITGKYASEGQGIASSVSAITDQFFDAYKERWNE